MEYDNYDIKLDDEKGSYSPHTDPQNVQNIQLQRQEEIYGSERGNNSPLKEKEQEKIEKSKQGPTGCTKFIQIQFYQQFFHVSQLEVAERIKLSFIPIKNNFIESLDNNPDLYGPFWLLTTMIFLLSSTGNLSRYFANHEKEAYLFKLQLVQEGLLVMYSFGFGFPVALYFFMKVLGVRRLNLPEVICIYGYSFSCFIVIFLLCIIPVKGLQWVFIAYGLVNTSLFLIMNLKDYLEDIQSAKKYVVFGVIVGTQVALFLIFKLIFFDLAFEGVNVDPVAPADST